MLTLPLTPALAGHSRCGRHRWLVRHRWLAWKRVAERGSTQKTTVQSAKGAGWPASYLVWQRHLTLPSVQASSFLFCIHYHRVAQVPANSATTSPRGAGMHTTLARTVECWRSASAPHLPHLHLSPTSSVLSMQYTPPNQNASQERMTSVMTFLAPFGPPGITCAARWAPCPRLPSNSCPCSCSAFIQQIDVKPAPPPARLPPRAWPDPSHAPSPGTTHREQPAPAVLQGGWGRTLL